MPPTVTPRSVACVFAFGENGRNQRAMSFGERWPGGELVTVVPQGAAVAQLKLAK